MSGGWLVTGTGAVASTGGGPAEIFDALCAGRTGLAELRGFDRDRFRCRHAYEIDDRPAPGVDVPMRATSWLLAAIGAAARDAGLGEDLSEVPVLVGTTLRELRSVELSWRDGHDFDARGLHFGPALRNRFGVTASYTVANACAASLYALGLAVDRLDLESGDTVVVAGVDTIAESTYGLLDRCYPEAPEALRPFDRNRRGMVQGEGAAAIVLRRAADGPGPGRVHARIRGVGINCDAYHPSAPDGDSIGRAMRDAQRRAGVKPADVDLVMLHGTGTALNDEAEAAAVAELFAGVSPSPLATAIKSMLGHTGGAAGLHSLIVAIESMRTGLIPPILGLADPIDEVATLRLVRDRVTTAPVQVAQVNSFGFGGLNAVAILEKVA
jgi:3-oxoacyl-[acyl-carrier-protein] synthase II